MIPLHFHFCWLTDQAKHGGKPFSYIHYLCLRSVMKLHPGARFNLYCNQQIRGHWFEKIASDLVVVKVPAPEEIFDIPIIRVEHKSDILRLNILEEHGGIYLDLDVFFKKSLHDLLNHRFVMGIEAETGLCNAVILSEKGSPFLKEWLAAYNPAYEMAGAGFDPNGWSEMSVQFPKQLAESYKDYITVLGPDAFFHPIGTGIGLKELFDSGSFQSPESYGHHLWESQSWDRYLSHLGPSDIFQRKGYFYKLVREVLTETEIWGN